MKLIKDLGMEYPNDTSKKKSRYGIYECPQCWVHFRTMTKTVKNGQSTKCRSCARSNQVRELKQLNSNDYSFILVKDLGLVDGTRKAVFQCPKCKKEFTRKAAQMKNTNPSMCVSCSSKTHGFSTEKLYQVWLDMKQRCYNEKCDAYQYYGSRGIAVCDEWKNSYVAFREYIISLDNYGKSGYSMDRINNDGNYEPTNVKMSSKSEQQWNTRQVCKSNTSGYRGVSFHKPTKNWAVKLMSNNKRHFVGYFDTAEEGARAYNDYVIANNLANTLNKLI
jgi:predicted RNA-binding Zn-ribbon protein involved in translation (DUF1610 family)